MTINLSLSLSAYIFIRILTVIIIINIIIIIIIIIVIYTLSTHIQWYTLICIHRYICSRICAYVHIYIYIYIYMGGASQHLAPSVRTCLIIAHPVPSWGRKVGWETQTCEIGICKWCECPPLALSVGCPFTILDQALACVSFEFPTHHSPKTSSASCCRLQCIPNPLWDEDAPSFDRMELEDWPPFGKKRKHARRSSRYILLAEVVIDDWTWLGLLIAEVGGGDLRLQPSAGRPRKRTATADGGSAGSRVSTDTVSFHNFKSQNFKLSVSNPKSKYVAYLSVLSQISNCQGLGRKNRFEILKTDRRRTPPIFFWNQGAPPRLLAWCNNNNETNNNDNNNDNNDDNDNNLLFGRKTKNRPFSLTGLAPPRPALPCLVPPRPKDVRV